MVLLFLRTPPSLLLLIVPPLLPPSTGGSLPPQGAPSLHRGSTGGPTGGSHRGFQLLNKILHMKIYMCVSLNKFLGIPETLYGGHFDLLFAYV